MPQLESRAPFALRAADLTTFLNGDFWTRTACTSPIFTDGSTLQAHGSLKLHRRRRSWSLFEWTSKKCTTKSDLEGKL